MKKNALNSTDKTTSSKLRETRSYNAKHEARDEKGRFTAGMKNNSAKEATSDRNTISEKSPGDCLAKQAANTVTVSATRCF